MSKPVRFKAIVWKNHSTNVITIPPDKMKEGNIQTSTRKDPSSMKVYEITIREVVA